MLRRLRIENLVLIREAELELGPGLTAITGETGAGKTILAQAIGLLLGVKGEAGFIGADAPEAYVEAELDLPDGLFEEDGLQALAELRPEGEDWIVLARRIFPDGRTRAYAWGRSIAREDLAAVAERLIAMSGQFQQRRLAQPAYHLDVLDAFVGEEQLRRRRDLRRAWQELLAARRQHQEIAEDATRARARIDELRALADDTAGLGSETEDVLRGERERVRRTAELGQAASAAVEALAPDDGRGAGDLVASAERAVAPLEGLAPELARAGEELREVALRLRETGTELRGLLASLETNPARLEEIEQELERISDLKRRFRVGSLPELLERAEAARGELGRMEAGFDPARASSEKLAAAESRARALSDELRAARRSTAELLAEAVSRELRHVGVGEGEFLVELSERELSPAGADGARFLIRPNPGLPLAPVTETASGGELSRIALAIAAVAGGETIVFDEIDAGIGGRTAHAVGETLRRLGERAQVITITHLPQIASLADRHFRVEKVPGDPTHTRIEPLADDDRREEIERMLGGEEFLALLSQGPDG